MSFLKKLFGQGPDFKKLVAEGAMIIDVRSPGEFATGHIKGSKNIPLQQLQIGVKTLQKEKVIITVCASGMRSASAKSQLKNLGYQTVENGGSWSRLNANLK